MPRDVRDVAAFEVSVDVVALAVEGDDLLALVSRRPETPYKGRWSLPGGPIGAAEDLPQTAARELAGADPQADVAHLEQLATYAGPGRDPRGRGLAVAYLALASPAPLEGPAPTPAGRWVAVEELLERPRTFAFDHARILQDGIERARARLEYTDLATAFCPPEFTIGELRRVYEVVWGRPLDPRNFHRKVTSASGFLAPTPRTTTRHGGRPARLYRRGRAERLEPPMVRPAA